MPKEANWPPPQETASYIIFKDGLLTKAKNGNTGDIQFSNANSATVIQAAINALLASGGMIWVKEATYSILSSLTLKSKVTLIGAGVGKTIFDAHTTVFTTPASDVDDVKLTDFTIVMDNASALNSAGILYQQGHRITFKDIEIKDTVETAGTDIVGIRFSYDNVGARRCYDIYMENINCHGRSAVLRDFNPFVMFWSERVYVKSCRFKVRDSDVPIDPAKGAAFGGESLKNVVFESCIFEYAHHNGFLLTDSTAHGHKSEHVLISNCVFEENGDDAIDPNYDFYLIISHCVFKNNQYQLVSFEDGCENCIVEGCTSEGTVVASNGIDIYASLNITITGNNLTKSGAGHWIFRAIRVSNSRNIQIVGNQIQGWSYGIVLENAAREVHIEGNFISDCGDGIIRSDGTASIVWRIYIESNHFIIGAHVSTAIILINTTRCIINGNFFSSYDESSGWLISTPITSSGTTHNVGVTNNTFRVHASSTYKFIGSHTKVRRNILPTTSSENIDGIRMLDEDGTMTGVANTPFTYEVQKGVQAALSTAAVALVQAVVTFPIQYPTGGATNGGPPTVITTLKDASVPFVGTLWVDQVTATGFRINLNVTVIGGVGSTVAVAWEANLPETW